ncbi:DUF6011 domain-containing protein [Heyndrickxia sp. NPDC080065]|uniref:DUF6011 domain-containing protein n=1 Tax=Heyndrickxia sp. NPDC080065 TaxID=3390568 RepID=UPI003D07122C
MNCPICNRPLKSKRSIERGIGPVCETKIAKLKEKENEDQISFDQELSEEE